MDSYVLLLYVGHCILFVAALIKFIDRLRWHHTVYSLYSRRPWNARRNRILTGFKLQVFLAFAMTVTIGLALIFPSLSRLAAVQFGVYLWVVTLLPCSIEVINTNHTLHVIRQVAMVVFGVVAISSAWWLFPIEAHDLRKAAEYLMSV